VDLDALRAFVITVQERSVSAAARRLYRSQSAVTRQIQALEHEVGGPLLDRRERPLAPTELGKAVLAYADRALTTIDELKSVATGALAGEPAGEFRVGIAFSLAKVFTRSPLAQFRRLFPRVSLSITSDWSRHLVAAVRDNSVDVALLLLPSEWVPPEPLDARRLGVEEMVVIAPRTTRLPKRLDFAVLADAQWVVDHEGGSCRAMLRQALAGVGAPMKVVAELNGPGLHIDLVAAGLGFALVAARALRTHPARDAVRVLAEPRFVLTVWFAVGRIAPALKPAVDFLQTGIARVLESRGSHPHPAQVRPLPSAVSMEPVTPRSA
jgi:DNA-binding transcriptional LysR family regulator